MKVLDKILTNLTNVWNILPKDIPALIINQGSGLYPLVSVDSTQICFHTGSYTVNMPISQIIYLDGYTIAELMTVINSMGYIATLTSEDPLNDNDYSARKAYALIEAYNVPLTPSASLAVFTSSSWKILYPIARAVSDWGNNLESAVPQMVATLTTDKWADYWATFFTTKRNSGESDSSLRTRMFMNLANLKTNNIALAEIVSFAVKGRATVTDISPSVFEIVIEPSYMSTASDVHSIIDGAKAGGVKYYLNYTGLHNEEDFKASFKVRIGNDFVNSDTISSTLASTSLAEVEPYGMIQINDSMTLNRDIIGTVGAVMQHIQNPRLLKDSAVMTLTLNGSVVQTATII